MSSWARSVLLQILKWLGAATKMHRLTDKLGQNLSLIVMFAAPGLKWYVTSTENTSYTLKLTAWKSFHKEVWGIKQLFFRLLTTFPSSKFRISISLILNIQSTLTKADIFGNGPDCPS